MFTVTANGHVTKTTKTTKENHEDLFGFLRDLRAFVVFVKEPWSFGVLPQNTNFNANSRFRGELMLLVLRPNVFGAPIVVAAPPIR